MIKAVCGHLLWSIDVAKIDDDGLRLFISWSVHIEGAELLPFRYNNKRIRVGRTAVRGVAAGDFRQFESGLLNADGVISQYLCTEIMPPSD
jgi:hypothetical protein